MVIPGSMALREHPGKALSSPPCFCRPLSETSPAQRWRAEERDIPSLLMPGLTSSKSGCPVGLTSRWCQENSICNGRMVSNQLYVHDIEC